MTEDLFGLFYAVLGGQRLPPDVKGLIRRIEAEIKVRKAEFDAFNKAYQRSIRAGRTISLEEYCDGMDRQLDQIRKLETFIIILKHPERMESLFETEMRIRENRAAGHFM